LPTTYFFENMRSVMMGNGVHWTQIALAYGLNIVYLSLSILFLARSFTHARQNGNLVKNY